ALAIEFGARGLEAADELSVRQPVGARPGVDANDPQLAEIALLAATAGERVVPRLVDGFLRRPIQLALVEEKALRLLQQLLALRAADRSSFYSRHLSVPLQNVSAVKYKFKSTKYKEDLLCTSYFVLC